MLAVTVIIAIATTVYVIVTVLLWLANKHMAESARDAALDARTQIIWERTREVWNEWWSDELADCRRYLWYKFEPGYRANLAVYESLTLKNVYRRIGNRNAARVRELAYFFDRLGWLAAEGLVQEQFILGPMQHAVKRAWWLLGGLIKRGRTEFDPVYLMGFEWLYERSMQRHQLDNIAEALKWLPEDTKANLDLVKSNIDRYEAKVREELQPGP